MNTFSLKQKYGGGTVRKYPSKRCCTHTSQLGQFLHLIAPKEIIWLASILAISDLLFWTAAVYFLGQLMPRDQRKSQISSRSIASLLAGSATSPPKYYRYTSKVLCHTQSFHFSFHEKVNEVRNCSEQEANRLLENKLLLKGKLTEWRTYIQKMDWATLFQEPGLSIKANHSSYMVISWLWRYSLLFHSPPFQDVQILWDTPLQHATGQLSNRAEVSTFLIQLICHHCPGANRG